MKADFSSPRLIMPTIRRADTPRAKGSRTATSTSPSSTSSSSSSTSSVKFEPTTPQLIIPKVPKTPQFKKTIETRSAGSNFTSSSSAGSPSSTKGNLIIPKIPKTPNRIQGRVGSRTNLHETIPSVPTCSREKLYTPRRTLYHSEIEKKKSERASDILLTPAVYLNQDKEKSKTTPKIMQKVSQVVTSFSRRHQNILQDCPKIIGVVSPEKFEELLLIYENNQMYYQDQLEDKTQEIALIRENLTILEHWFLLIIEPQPRNYDLESWNDRYLSINQTGYSAYGDPDLQTYITPLSLDQRVDLMARYRAIK